MLGECRGCGAPSSRGSRLPFDPLDEEQATGPTGWSTQLQLAQGTGTGEYR